MKKILCCILAVFLLIDFMPASAVSSSAAAAVVINGDTGEVIYSQNADTRLPMASTTKIMTALLLCEQGDLDREITVTKEMVAVEGSSMGLLPGDTVSLRGLLYGMLLASGNDAANTTAIVIDGSVDKFAERMNDRAKEMGLTDTHFVTPSGLDAQEHYTTARELALIAREALKNEDFAAAAQSEYETLYYGNPPYRRTLKNHNKLLGSYEGLIGVKTGFTKKSGRCLVTAAKRDGKYVIAVTLNDPDDWNDHRSLLDYGLASLQCIELSDDTVYSLKPADAGMSELTLKSETVSFTAQSSDGMNKRVFLPKFYYGGVLSGEKVGEIRYYKDGEAQKTADITATESSSKAKSSFITKLKNQFLYILSFL